MIVALVLAVLVAIAATTALLLQRRTLAGCRAEAAAALARAGAAEEEVATSRDAAATAESRAAALDAAHREGEAAVAELRVTLSAAGQQAADAAARLRDCDDELTRTRDQLATTTEARSRADEARIAAEELAARGAEALDAAAAVEACWRLLLARVERQWAQAVGAGMEERGVAPAPADEQLHQAVVRELERLREEVGLDTAVHRTGPGPTEGHPLLLLLLLGELVALAAPHSERVVVALGPVTGVTGEGWDADPAAADGLRAALAVAGLGGEVVANGTDVHVRLGPSAPPPPGTAEVSRR